MKNRSILFSTALAILLGCSGVESSFAAQAPQDAISAYHPGINIKEEVYNQACKDFLELHKSQTKKNPIRKKAIRDLFGAAFLGTFTGEEIDGLEFFGAFTITAQKNHQTTKVVGFAYNTLDGIPHFSALRDQQEAKKEKKWKNKTIQGKDGQYHVEMYCADAIKALQEQGYEIVDHAIYAGGKGSPCPGCAGNFKKRTGIEVNLVAL